MLKSNGKLVYLAGEIHGCEDPYSWRLAAKEMLPKGWGVIDPTASEFQHRKDEDLIRMDLYLVSRCRCLIVKATNPSWGTAMELRAAYLQRIPVIAFDTPMPCSPWLSVHVSKFVGTLQEAVRELQ